MADDPRLHAARYRVSRDTGAPEEPPRPTPTRAQLTSNAEIALQQAMRRGDFDDLPGAGKPLTGLTDRHDPDWWIKQKIQNENLTGLGPPALTLRVENRQLDARLDAMASEHDVRAALDDFNHRVIEARRQLLGGPPVVTPTRDVEAEVSAWQVRAQVASSRAAATEIEPVTGASRSRKNSREIPTRTRSLRWMRPR